jgi:hypothetical protein
VAKQGYLAPRETIVVQAVELFQFLSEPLRTSVDVSTKA